MINKQKAIDAIEFEKVYMTAYKNGINEGNLFEQYNKGLDDAIKAINNLSSICQKGEVEEIVEVYRNEDVIYHYITGICPNCGETTYDHAKYCIECGIRLEWNNEHIN